MVGDGNPLTGVLIGRRTRGLGVGGATIDTEGVEVDAMYGATFCSPTSRRARIVFHSLWSWDSLVVHI